MWRNELKIASPPFLAGKTHFRPTPDLRRPAAVVSHARNLSDISVNLRLFQYNENATVSGRSIKSRKKENK